MRNIVNYGKKENLSQTPFAMILSDVTVNIFLIITSYLMTSDRVIPESTRRINFILPKISSGNFENLKAINRISILQEIH